MGPETPSRIQYSGSEKDKYIYEEVRFERNIKRGLIENDKKDLYWNDLKDLYLELYVSAWGWGCTSHNSRPSISFIKPK